MPDKARESFGTERNTELGPASVLSRIQKNRSVESVLLPVAAVEQKYCNWKRAVKHTGISLCVFEVFGLAVQSLLRQSRVTLKQVVNMASYFCCYMFSWVCLFYSTAKIYSHHSRLNIFTAFWVVTKSFSWSEALFCNLWACCLMISLFCLCWTRWGEVLLLPWILWAGTALKVNV